MSSSATAVVVRAQVRRSPLQLVGLVILTAVGLGAAVGALGAADRTERAYPEYVEAADVADLVINPSIATPAMDAAIRRFPGVVSVDSDTLLLATISRTTAGTFEEIVETDPSLQVRGSTDGRYADGDRPAISSGRFATGTSEIFISDEFRPIAEAAAGHALSVGDHIDVAFWWTGLADVGEPGESYSPVAVESLRIAGFGRLPDEVLPDELYPRQRVVVSSDVAARHSCLSDIDRDMTADEAFAAAFPADCSSAYWYYSLHLDGAPGRQDAIRARFSEVATELTDELPPSISEFAGYFYVSQSRSDLDDDVSQTTLPPVAALTAFGGVAATATLALIALLVARMLRRADDVQRGLLNVGATRPQRASALGVAPLAALAIGVAGALLVAVLMSPVAPIGSVRDIATSTGFALPGAMPIVALVLFSLVGALVVGGLSVVAARRATDRRARRSPSAWRAALLGSGSPALTSGLRAAVGPRLTRRAAFFGGCVVAVVIAVATVVFGANLSALVTQPERYGWTWDVGVITGGGYGDADAERVDADLAGRSDVRARAFYAFDPATRIRDTPVATVYGFAGAEDFPFPVVRGRAATRPGEAVVGATTGDEIELSIGDRVTVVSDLFTPRDVEIVGVAVFPSLGSFIADRTGLGSGLFVMMDVTAGGRFDPTFVGIDVQEGVEPATFLTSVRPSLPSWSLLGETPFTYVTPVRPAEIVNVSDIRGAPLLLATTLAVALVVGLGLAINAAVRDRRSELAVLRALGFTSRGLYVTVLTQALVMITVGLIVGVPVGILAGRFAWRSFATRLGVVPGADVPVASVSVVVLLGLILAAVAAALPARAATRLDPTGVLRSS